MSGPPELELPAGRVALQAGLPWFFTVATGSMKPLLWPGATVEVRPCEAGDLRVGDILCVARGEGLLVHRMVAWREVAGARHVVTRGDRADADDPPTPLPDVLGRVVRIGAGRLSFGITGPVGARLGALAGRLWPLTGPLRWATRPLRR